MSKFFTGDTKSYVISEWRIQREVVENIIGRAITDEEWFEFTSELDGRVENYCNELFDDLVGQVRDGIFKPRPLGKPE